MKDRTIEQPDDHTIFIIYITELQIYGEQGY